MVHAGSLRRWAQLLLPSVACLIASVMMYSCGADARPEPVAAAPTPKAETAQEGTRRLGHHLVSDEQVRAQPAGSPQRTLLAFWQAVQFQDVNEVRSLLAPALARQYRGARLARLLTDATAGFAALPEIRGVRRDGDDAIIRLSLTYYRGDGDAGALIARSLDLRETPDGWRIADLDFAVAEAAKARRAAASRGR